MHKNASLFLVFAFAYTTWLENRRSVVRRMGENAFFSTVFSTAVEKSPWLAGLAEPDGECSRGVWRPKARRRNEEEGLKDVSRR